MYCKQIGITIAKQIPFHDQDFSKQIIIIRFFDDDIEVMWISNYLNLLTKIFFASNLSNVTIMYKLWKFL